MVPGMRIVGCAVNQDGRSSALTAPNGPSQQMVIQRALQSGGVTPSSLAGLQMHGTGTPLGDPVEVGALGAVLLPAHGDVDGSGPLVLSAVKSCVGHAEAAAGLSGVLQQFAPLTVGVHSPVLHLRDVNPLVADVIDHHEAKGSRSTFMPRSSCSFGVRDVDAGHMGVSSFAYQGTNAHAVLHRVADAFFDAGPCDLDPASVKIRDALETKEVLFGEHLPSFPFHSFNEVVSSTALWNAFLHTSANGWLGLQALVHGSSAGEACLYFFQAYLSGQG